MNNTEKKITPIRSKPANTPIRKAFRRFRIVLYMAIFVLVVGGVIAFVVNRDQIDARTVADLLSWIRAPFASDETESSAFSYDDYMLSEYRDFQNGLALLSESRFVIIDRAGKQRFAQDVTLKEPALATSKNSVVAYDRGGDSFLLSDGARAVVSKKWDNPIFLVNMNENGYYVVVSSARGYKSTATVYTPKQEVKYYWYSAENYILDAQLSPDAGRLLILSVGQNGEQLSSRVTLLDTAQSLDDQTAGAPLYQRDSAGIVSYKAHFFDSGGFCVLFEDRLDFFDDNGLSLNSYAFNTQVLRAYDLSGKDFAALLLSRSTSGSRGTLVVIDSSGAKAELKLTDIPLSLSAKGSYIGMLGSGSAVLYDDMLNVLVETKNVNDAQAMLVRDDKSALLLSSNGTAVLRP